MCEIRTRGKTIKKEKKSTMKQKEMDCDEPHLTLNGKTQPI